MRLTEEAIMQAIRYTQQQKSDLESNYAYMKNTTTSLLIEWKDKHVERFLDMMELFDSYVKNTAANMDRIEEVLRDHLRFLIEYNS